MWSQKSILSSSVLLFLALFAFHCGDSKECKEGESRVCQCGDLQGTQTCKRSGDWDICHCSTKEKQREEKTSPSEPFREKVDEGKSLPDANTFDSPVEKASEALPEESVHESPKVKDHRRKFCPAKCQSDADCNVPDCRNRTKCLKRISRCVDSSLVCPESCEKDSDCSSHKGCLAKTMCYKSSPQKKKGTCEVPASGSTCPTSCKTSYDCLRPACQKRRFCNKTTHQCVDGSAMMCPSRCSSDKDCPIASCGLNNTCKNGKCQTSCPSHCKKDSECAPCHALCYFASPAAESGTCQIPTNNNVCPARCKTNRDCLSAACGKKRFCNTTTSGTCVEGKVACPKRCQTDSDCHAVFGCEQNACFIPNKTGYCIPLGQSQSCPARCRTHRDCFVVGCKKRRKCDSRTRRCVQ